MQNQNQNEEKNGGERVIRLICSQCGKIQQVHLATGENNGKTIRTLYTKYAACPRCKRIFDWQHPQVIIRD